MAKHKGSNVLDPEVEVTGPTIGFMRLADLVSRYRPGKAQFSRFGGTKEWDIGPLVEQFMAGKYDPDLGLVEICGEEILDGNRRSAALGECMNRQPAQFSNLQVKVRQWPLDLTREQKEQIRLQAAKGTKPWDKVDFLHAMVNLILEYPGKAPEKYLAEAVGEHRILEQFPGAIKRRADGSFELDAKGEKIYQNRQGVFQDARRLALLPKCVREMFFRGIRGEGPAVASKLLTSLTASWEKDQKDDPTAAARGATCEVAELGGELGGRLKPILAAETAQGRTAGKGVMSAKDMDATISTFSASRLAVALVSYVARKPGYPTEKVNTMLRDLFGQVEVMIGLDDAAKVTEAQGRLRAGIAALAAEVTTTK